jgi:hypothetical protein
VHARLLTEEPLARETRRWYLFSMSKVESLEKRISALSAEELAEFRQWFAEFDAAAWDRQIERDAKAGKLDALADEALRDHAAGKSTEF